MKNLKNLFLIGGMAGLSLGSLKSYSQGEYSSMEHLQALKNVAKIRGNSHTDPLGNHVNCYSLSLVNRGQKSLENEKEIVNFSISLHKSPKDTIFIISKEGRNLDTIYKDNPSTGEMSMKVYTSSFTSQTYIDYGANGLRSKEDKYGTETFSSLSTFSLETQQKIKENYESLLKETYINIKMKLLEE